MKTPCYVLLNTQHQTQYQEAATGDVLDKDRIGYQSCNILKTACQSCVIYHVLGKNFQNFNSYSCCKIINGLLQIPQKPLESGAQNLNSSTFFLNSKINLVLWMSRLGDLCYFKSNFRLDMIDVVPWYWTTSLNNVWIQVLRRFKSCSRRVGDSRWWGSLTMVLTGNKAKSLSSVNHTTKTIHHHRQQRLFMSLVLAHAHVLDEFMQFSSNVFLALKFK